jgi:hypothetical protein
MLPTTFNLSCVRRLKYGIRRDVSGRAQLRRSDGTWMQCKLDMEVSGTMLLRNTKDGSVHVLQTDRLEQVRIRGWLTLHQRAHQQCVAEDKALNSRFAPPFSCHAAGAN